MQKLVWQNANGVELDLTSGNFGVTNWEGFSNASLNIQSQQVPFQDGGVFLDALIEQREISVTLAMQDNNNLELRYRNRRELISALNPKLGEGYLIYTNDFTSKRIKCIPQIPIFETHNSDKVGTPKASLSWTACEPYWEDLEETEFSLLGYSQGTVDYNGDYKSNPEVVLIGNAVNPRLRNISNNTQLLINGNVGDSIINLASGKKTFNKQKLGFYLNNSEGRTMFAENDSLQVIVGSATITITKDLKEFKVVRIADNEAFTCCCYGKGLFVVGGDNIVKSADGEQWEDVTKPSGLVEACYYDKIGELFYFSIDGVLYSSSDLTTFTQLANIINAVNRIIRHKNAIYCVTNNTTSSSHYGCFKYENGTLTALSTGVKENLYSIVSDGADLIIVGKNGILLVSSDDGDTWESRNVTETLRDICYDQDTSQFVICGDNGVYGYGVIDNITWITREDTKSDFCFMSKLFGFIEIFGTEIIIFKNNAFESTGSTPRFMLCGVYFKNRYLVGGMSGVIYASANLKEWETINLGITHDIIMAECNENCAYLMSKEGDIIYTEDGTSFRLLTPPPTNRALNTIVHFNGKYYATTSHSGNPIFKSVDGKSWQIATNLYDNLGGECLGVVNNKLYFMKDTHLLETSDGDTWVDYDLSSTGYSINMMVFYNGVYVCVCQEDSRYVLATTTDFQNFTQIYSDLNIMTISVANNNFYFWSIIITEEEQIIASLYQGDLVNKTLIKQYTDTISYGVLYNDNHYIINLVSVNGNGAKTSEVTEDFSTYTTNNYIVQIENGREYHWIYDDDYITITTDDGEIIWKGTDNEEVALCYDIMVYGTMNNGWYVKSLITLEILSYPITSITTKYWDNEYLYICNGNVVYKFSRLDCEAFIESDVDISGIAGFENTLYLINCLSSYHTYRTIQVYDKETGDFIKTIESGVYQSADYSNGVEDVYNGIAGASNTRIVWFETSQDETTDRICTHNLITGEQERTSKSIQVTDMIYRNQIFYALGSGGILYSVEGGIWNNVSNARFTFRYFIRNKYYYFVGLFNYIGFLKYLIGDNIVDQVEKLSLCLETGENNLVLTYDSGEMMAILKYRQKYIGV